MPIPDHSQTAYMGLSPQLRDVLLKNGMKASVMLDTDNKLKLIVEGHDSPRLSYAITEAQLRTLSRMGSATGSDLKAAYKTFTSIVGKDFYMPVDLTHAKNVNNRVSMGLHGYRLGIGEPGSNPYFYRPILGWTPRQQGGYHLRRMAGTVFYGGGPWVIDRSGSRLKPGELAAGGYGFYWKGTANGQSLINTPLNGAAPTLNPDSQQQLLDQLSQIKLQKSADLPQPKKYSQEITSDVYFTTDKFLEVLTSHGILLDKDAKTMTLRSEAVDFDMVYTLSEGDMAILTDNSLESHPLPQRIDLINQLYGNDFKQKLTYAELDSDHTLNFEIGDHVSTLYQSSRLSDQVQNSFVANNGIITSNSNGIITSNSNGIITSNSNGVVAAGEEVEVNSNQTVVTEQKPVPYRGEEFTDQQRYGELSQPQPLSQPQSQPQLVSQQISQNLDGSPQIYVPQSQGMDAQEYYKVQSAVLGADPKQVAQVNGEDINYLNPDKGWYREGSHGRAVTVEQIIVYPVADSGKKDEYMMTAVINGEMISHNISQKDFDKFHVLDDFHRMKLFSKIFPEVDLKDHDSVGLGTKIVAGLAAGLTVASEVMRPMPPYGGMGRDHGSVYFKPGVDSPSDIAHRAFEAGMNTERMDCDLHHGW